MREELLHFIWRFRYFNQQALFTESGEPVQVLSPGESHTHQGPDFKNARIRLGDHLLEGAVEIHVVTSDWVRHAHDQDRHYAETILHVVWEDDWTGGAPPGGIPILVLRERVPKLLLHRYERWMKSRGFVPCERQLPEVAGEAWPGWLETLAEQRLRRRSVPIRLCLEDNRQHWEATTWIWMARAMGLPVNGDAFEAIARSLPVELLTRHRGTGYSSRRYCSAGPGCWRVLFRRATTCLHTNGNTIFSGANSDYSRWRYPYRSCECDRPIFPRSGWSSWRVYS